MSFKTSPPPYSLRVKLFVLMKLIFSHLFFNINSRIIEIYLINYVLRSRALVIATKIPVTTEVVEVEKAAADEEVISDHDA